MGVLEALCDLGGDVEHRPGREDTVGGQQPVERPSAHQLHRQEGVSFVNTEVVDVDHVGVAEESTEASLPHEDLLGHLVRSRVQRSDHLERDLLAEA